MEKIYSIVGITACTAGIAHTYMAQDAIVQEATRRGWKVKIETQGTVGKENVLSSTDVAQADYVLIASDVKVDMGRFANKMVLQSNVSAALKNPEQLLDDLITKAKLYEVNAAAQASDIDMGTQRRGVVDHLMSGISYMIPFVIAGGLLLAISGLITNLLPMNAKNQTVYSSEGQKAFLQALGNIGVAGLNTMVPIFAAFCAYSIADKAAIAPGFIAGYLINSGSFLGVDLHSGVTPPGATSELTIAAGGGIIGGMIIGLFSGFVVFLFKLIAWPKSVSTVANFLLLPIVCTLILGVIVKFVAGIPIAIISGAIFDGIEKFYHLFPSSKLILAVIIGAMMAIDLGGPINKIAWTFGQIVLYQTLGQSDSGWQGSDPTVWTAVEAAGAVPPIGMWLSTRLFKNKFTKKERDLGTAAFFAGLVGISEGAIPYAVRDPFRCVIANILGSIVASIIAVALTIRFYVGLGSPLGVIIGYVERFNWPYVAVVFAWFLATFAGIGVTAIVLGLLKRKVDAKEQELLKEEKANIKMRWSMRRAYWIMLFKDQKQFKTITKNNCRVYFGKKNDSIKVYWINVGNIFKNYFVGIKVKYFSNKERLLTKAKAFEDKNAKNQK